MKPKLILGIDVSKSDLDYLAIVPGSAWPKIVDSAVEKLSNEVSSIRSFLLDYDRSETLFVFEPTGSYSDKLMQLLIKGGYHFVQVNSQQFHYFSKTMGMIIKTDPGAARLLAYMGSQLDLRHFEPL